MEIRGEIRMGEINGKTSLGNSLENFWGNIGVPFQTSKVLEKVILVSNVRFHVNFISVNGSILCFDKILDVLGALKWYWGPEISIIS